MATISVDYELLRQPLQEKTLSGALAFRAVFDSAHRPIIFSIDNDGQLLLVAAGTTGDFTVTNLSNSLGLPPSDKVTALALAQAKNLDIYLAFAAGDGRTPSKLFVFPPLAPTPSEWGPKLDAFTSPETPTAVVISKLLLSPKPDESGYPFLAAVIAEPGKEKKDVARVDVNPTTRSWKWASDLSFPFNIDDMVDYCAGSIPGSSGIFAIDHTQGKPTLTFAGVRGTGPGPRAPLNYNLPIVANPRSVATTLDEDGFTNVLVGGDGVLHISSQDCVDSVDVGTLRPPTFADAALLGTHKLTVAQTGDMVTMWALNGNHTLVGQSAKLELDDDAGVDKLLAAGAAVPLLAGGEDIQTFDAIVHPFTRSQQLFCLKKDGSVSCLQQAGDSKLWSEENLRIPDPEDVEDVNTYACQIKIKGEGGQPLVNTDIQLSASTETFCVANGWRMTIGRSPMAAKTDTKGVVSLVIPAPDLNVPTIKISGSGLTSTSFHPAFKAVAKLSSTAQNGGLGRARRADGSALFPNVDHTSATAIVDLCQRYTDLHQKSSNDSSSANSSSDASSHLAASAALANTEDHGLLWQLWHGLISGVEKIVGFVYDAGVFIVKTAAKVFRFIVEKAEQALSAISGLFKIIGALIEDAVVWLAEKLDWDSILDTMTIFDEFFNTGIDVMQDLIAEGGDAVDRVFESVEKQVGSWHLPPVLPEKVASLKPDLDKEKSSRDLSLTDSPLFNWANNQMEKGDAKSRMATATKASDPADFTQVLKKMYDEIVAPLGENLKDTFAAIWEDFKKLFGNDPSVTWVDIFKNMGVDILLGIIRGVRKLVHGILAVSESFLSWIKAIMNKPIDIWVVSKLFRKITKGKALTIMSLTSLLLAVPTTWIFKALHGKSPRDVPQIAELLDVIRNDHARGVPAPAVSDKALGSAVSDSSNQAWSSHLQSVQHMTTFSSAVAIKANSSTDAKDAPLHESSAVANTNIAPPNFDVNALLKKSSISRMTWLLRLGALVKSCGIIAYTAIDTVYTGFVWFTLGPDVFTDEDPEWKKGPAVYLAIVMGLFSFPIEKLSRNTGGVALRILTWMGTGLLNVFKAGIPGIVKPNVAGVVGVIDAVMYLIILGVEGDGDPPLEWTQRLLADAWAGGSMYNGLSGGKEPWGLGITCVIGLVMNGEGWWLAGRQITYFANHDEDDVYDPPTWHSSLNGSLM